MNSSCLHSIAWIVLCILMAACEKNKPSDPGNKPETPPPDEVVKPQQDPPLAPTIGFFLNEWQPKTFARPGSFSEVTPPGSASTIVHVDRSVVVSKVPPTLFGNNANTWMTQMVTEPALIAHLTQNKPGYIRFPGGSISDLFFWNANANQPPFDAPAQLLNSDGIVGAAGYWYGKNAANWTLSVDNYYNMLQQTGNKGLITINYGYARYGTGQHPVEAAAHLAADWVRYDNGRTLFWEIGNENFGNWEAGYRINTSNNKDGQPEFVNGKLYATHFKVFADSMRKAAAEKGRTIYIGALLVDSEPASWETETFKTWNSGALPELGSIPDFYVVHNYYTPYHANSSAAEILSTGSSVTKRIMQYVKQQIKQYGLPEKPVAMDEWNIFATGSRQMVSHIAGLHAASALSEMLKQQYGLACRWDLANAWEDGNDHGWLSQGDEPDGIPKWTPRPAFYHMYYFQKVLGDRTVSATTLSTAIEAYASSFSSGETGVVLINKEASALVVEVKIDNFLKGNNFYWYMLTGGSDNVAFSRKVFVNGKGPDLPAGGPANYLQIEPYAASTANGIKIAMPPRSAAYMVVDKK
ncbi:alpha-L-arabinofuranosidase [Niabella insulamsoli]|uniref:alpha-L-arabinofuranosidase n=1 Tax=Niabella insulamsoli TaxID=3144874 RepID=UPI0031FBCE3C